MATVPKLIVWASFEHSILISISLEVSGELVHSKVTSCSESFLGRELQHPIFAVTKNKLAYTHIISARATTGVKYSGHKQLRCCTQNREYLTPNTVGFLPINQYSVRTDVPETTISYQYRTGTGTVIINSTSTYTI